MLWNLFTGSLITTLENTHQGGITSVKILADSHPPLIITSGFDKTIGVFEIQGLIPIKRFSTMKSRGSKENYNETKKQTDINAIDVGLRVSLCGRRDTIESGRGPEGYGVVGVADMTLMNLNGVGDVDDGGECKRNKNGFKMKTWNVFGNGKGGGLGSKTKKWDGGNDLKVVQVGDPIVGFLENRGSSLVSSNDISSGKKKFKRKKGLKHQLLKLKKSSGSKLGEFIGRQKKRLSDNGYEMGQNCENDKDITIVKVKTLRGHTGDVYCIDIPSGGLKVVSGSLDQTLKASI